jgi:hypothetical protein
MKDDEYEIAIDASWRDYSSDPLDDIAAMAETVRQESGIMPDTILCNLKTYAYLVLGRFLVEIQCGLIAVYRYQLPRSTFKQHWNDCFGWAVCW